MSEINRPSALVQVVLDTNLLVSSLVSKSGTPYLLMERFYGGEFQIVFSLDLAREYQDVLARPQLIEKFGINQDEIDSFFEALSIDGQLVTPVKSVPIEVRDPKDVKVVAAAIGGQADYLVTGDKDLLTLVGDPRLSELKIVTAREFLDILQATD